MIVIRNVPGDYNEGGIRIRVTHDKILIDTTALALYSEDTYSPSAVPINRENRRPRPMREMPEKQKDEMIDRVGKSSVKAVKYINDIFWGEK